MSENLSAMQADVSGLIDTWGVNCVISRLSGTMTASKRYSGSFVNVASGTMWVQPLTGSSRRSDPGILEETTHIALARASVDARAGDKLTPSGSSYAYDVLATDENPTHDTIQLRRSKRS